MSAVPDGAAGCELCEAAPLTERFYEDDDCWIAECESCSVPMVVWRVHDPEPPDDVKAIAVPALAHRLVLRPELWVQRVSSEDVVREVLETVPTPRAEDVAAAPHA